MSDEDSVPFRAINAKKGDKREIYYSKGILKIQVTLEEKEQIILTPEETNECLKKAAKIVKSIERATEALIL